MRDAALPAVFSPLMGKIDYVQYVTGGEWSSSCPQCSESGHDSKSGYPDRFRMWTNATHGKNPIMGWCRQCGYTWFPDGDKKMSPSEFSQWKEKQYAVEKDKRDKAQRAMELLKSERAWEKYHEALTDGGMEILKTWGLDGFDIEYWKLGMIPEYTVWPKEYISPAATIPMWDFGSEVNNVKVRVLNPREPSDRYRSLYKVGDRNTFVAYHDTDFDTVVMVEGEKKAMVVAKQNVNAQVISIPSKTPSEKSLQKFAKYGKVYVCLDPDAKLKTGSQKVSALGRIIHEIGKERVAYVNLPMKVDDAINEYGLDFPSAMKNARTF